MSSKKETIIHDSTIISKSVIVTHTKNRSNDEISNYVTNNKKSKKTSSKTSASFLASLEYCECVPTVGNLGQTESQKLDESKKKHTETIGGKNNKRRFTVQKKRFRKTQIAY